MAKVTVTWTNGRKMTHVQGRESHPHNRFERRSGVPRHTSAHHCKRVCVLNEDEAYQMEVHHVAFPCHNASRPHTHYSREQAEVLVDSGEARWIGGNVMVFVRAKTWLPMPSGGMTVMQMVPGVAVY